MFYTILGGPGAGKGTRSKILSEKLNIPHVSTGEIFRKVSETNSSIKDALEKGLYISDEITTNLLYERITQDDCKNGCVLDGYPRNINQVHLLNKILKKLGKKLSASIKLDVPEQVIFERILGRQECSRCGQTYGTHMQPKVKGVCDKCHATLIRRSDDNEQTLKTRIEIYNTQVAPVIDYYNKQGLLVTVDASDDPRRILTVVNC